MSAVLNGCDFAKSVDPAAIAFYDRLPIRGGTQAGPFGRCIGSMAVPGPKTGTPATALAICN